MENSNGTTITIIIAILTVLTTYTLIKISTKLAGSEVKCKNSIPLHTTLITDCSFNNVFSINKFHIKTAYNCCAVSDRWVDLCALKYTINERCRCLDFAIFDYDGYPVVGTTTTPNGQTMDSYNYINFDKVMETIIQEGFLYNIQDPLFINLRIKSSSLDLYNMIAIILRKHLTGSKLVPINHTIYNNAGSLPTLNSLKEKVVVMISDCNHSIFDGNDCVLNEYTNILGGVVNINSNASSCNTSFNDYKLIQFNNGHIMSGDAYEVMASDVNNDSDVNNAKISISIPDDINYNPNFCYYKNIPINFIGMSFQYDIKPSKKTLTKNLKSVNINENIPYDDIPDTSKLLEYERIGNLNNYNKLFKNHSFIPIQDYKNPDVEIVDCNTSPFNGGAYGNFLSNPGYLQNNGEKTEKKRTYWYESITKPLSNYI